MRRVVVTGMGIVSSIGNNTQEVLASLREARSGIVARRELRRARLPLPGARRADARPRGRASTGAPCASTAAAPPGTMSRWIRRSATPGSSRARSPTSAPASSWARAAPRPAPSSRPPTSTRTKGPKRVGPFAVPKAMSLDRLGDARRPGSRSRASAIRSPRPARPPTIASATPTSTSSYGKQDVMFAGGCEELDWTLSVLFDAMGAMSSRYNDAPARRLARL